MERAHHYYIHIYPIPRKMLGWEDMMERWCNGVVISMPFESMPFGSMGQRKHDKGMVVAMIRDGDRDGRCGWKRDGNMIDEGNQRLTG